MSSAAVPLNAETTAPEVSWLWDLCDPSRAALATPFQIARDGGAWTVATNGRLLAMRPGEFGFGESGPKMGAALQAPTEPSKRVSLDALRALLPPPAPPRDLCSECGGSGFSDCAECEGHGWIECECDCGDLHEKKCRACKGEGRGVCSCGAVAPKMLVCWIGDSPFNLSVLAPALRALPDSTATVRGGGIAGALWFEVGAWTLVLMPLRVNDDGNYADAPRIELTEVTP